MPTARELIELLRLEPHHVEGGYFRRTYTAHLSVTAPDGRIRAASTAIYYLLEPGTFSEMHRLPSDELFHFYLGDPVEMLQLWPGGRSAHVTLGPDILAGHQPQTLVPGGVWQGTRLLPGGSVALLGCTVTPGFDFADYTRGSYADLAAAWPSEADLLRTLTRFSIRCA